jgi:hypothetical protein
MLRGISALIALVPLALAAGPATREKMIFDFEEADAVKAWSNLELPKSKEPAVKIERSTGHATSGKHSLKLTFAGGDWPTITTTSIPADWTPYRTFRADVTVKRHCVIGFTVMQEKSERGGGWEQLISRWTRTVFLKPGLNRIAASLPQPNEYAIHRKWGKAIRFEVFMYRPGKGELVHLDNIRLTDEKPPVKPTVKFTLAGTDWSVMADNSARAVIELGKKHKAVWVKPPPRSVEQVEADLRKRLAALKGKHPRAVLYVLRDGQKGYDPARPEVVYAGWRDAYWNSHGPDSNFVDRAGNRGGSASHEVFMRHRSPLMRVDLSCIPAGSKVLHAELMLSRIALKGVDVHTPEKKPTMWVVEACNRPWEEMEVNAFEYARGKFWKEAGGMDWGEDGDFSPHFLAHGPGTGKASTWDFTHAVRYWTEGKHANHGFMLHGDSHDYMVAHSREAKAVMDRPAVYVIVEPAGR